ncbi:2-hydroxyacyl-CoA dehydratase [Phenylobacterium terrae]|uniref:2-hydroxyacyl-CoA dehydratase n=1 Tax=Phenylobacterium terrae TaxID=2665495 RepID=A0ABW4MV62_9CAUL
MSADDREASRARHEALTQLQVSRSLRAYQRDWFAGLRQQVFEEGRPYAIASALVPHEIWEALDIPFITDVWYSGLVAARRQSGHYSDFLGRQGYHEGLSRYGALTLGVLLDEDNPDKPWGGLPKPSLVCTGAGDRSGRLIADYAGCPYVPLEMPSLNTLHPEWWKMSRWQWEDLDETFRIDLMAAQFEELIAVSEKVAGKKLDRDRLAEIVARVNRQEEYFDEVREIIIAAPKLPARLGEVMSQVMGIQWHRGTEWALEQARAFRDEVKQRAETEQWVCPNEQFRLMYVGQGLWQNLDFFTEFEERYGAVFVRSNYLSIASDGYLRYGGRDPVRALASRYCTMSEQMHIPGLGSAWAIEEARRHRVDGGLAIEGWWGGRMINVALEEAGVPVLNFPVDAVDANTWDQSKMWSLVGEFIETRVAPAKARRTSTA